MLIHLSPLLILILVPFHLHSKRFTRFGVRLGNTVNCDTLAPQRKHEKTIWFYANYQLFYIVNAFLICFFVYISTVKRVNFDHAKKQVNYIAKLRRPFAPRNPSAIELHFVCQTCTFYQDLPSLVGITTQR